MRSTRALQALEVVARRHNNSMDVSYYQRNGFKLRGSELWTPWNNEGPGGSRGNAGPWRLRGPSHGICAVDDEEQQQQQQDLESLCAQCAPYPTTRCELFSLIAEEQPATRNEKRSCQD